MMTMTQQELLSAFVDGELNEQQLDELLALVDNNDSAKSNLMQYQFSSDIMHGYVTGKQPLDISQSIAEKIADEPNLSVAKSKTTKSKIISVPDWFWKQTAGFAVAASVGALAVVGLMTTPQNSSPSAQFAQTTSVQQQASVNESNRWTVGEGEVEDRLNDYLVDHNEYAGAAGLFSYARVVSYGEE